MTDFSSEVRIKAVRKARPCCACSENVGVGQPAIRWTGCNGGDFASVIYHTDCREAELALNKLHGTWANDEWIGLWDFDPKDGEWLLAEYPAVAARKGVTAELVAEWAEQRASYWKRA